jgi:CHAT domain-containing protein/tetratricopeptide (TPR) repeat protein
MMLVLIPIIICLIFVGTCAQHGFGQTTGANQIQALPPNQTIEREIRGAETHLYKFDLKADEFFQVRVEQKGVDVALTLLDSNGDALATMDSPNGKQGPETLSFVAQESGSFVLEVKALDAKVEKGTYSIRSEASRHATPADKKRVEIERLFVEGMKAASTESQTDSALAKLEEALKGWHELGDVYLTELTERQVKGINLKARTKAVIAEFSAPINLVAEGRKLLHQGTSESVLAARTKFAEAVEASRRFSKKLNDGTLSELLTTKDIQIDWKVITKGNEADALSALGSTYIFFKEWQEGVTYDKSALAVLQEMRQDPEIFASKSFNSYPFPFKASEAALFETIGSTLSANLNKPQDGLTYAERALVLWREVGQENEKFRATAEFQESLALRLIAQSYYALDDRQKAAYYFEQALTIYRRIPNQKRLTAQTLFELGNLYSGWLDYAHAREYWTEASQTYEELGDKAPIAEVLGQIGLGYLSLGDKTQAHEYFKRELAILLSDDYLESLSKQQSENPLPLPSEFKVESSSATNLDRDRDEWQRSTSIGNIYSLLGDNEKALPYFENALTSAQAAKFQAMIRLSLLFIGNVYLNQSKWEQALDYYQRALEISRRLTQHSDIASDLSSIASVYIQMKNWPAALPKATEALLIYELLASDQNRVVMGYSGALNVVARIQDELGNRRLAIFYEKQSVNAIQREREQLKNLDQEAQRSYLKQNEKPYHRLAEWLISENRLDEAVQVINLLRDQEFFDFNRDMSQPPGQLVLTARESVTIPSLQAGSQRIVTAEQPLIALKRRLGNRQPTADENIELKRLEADFDKATADWQTTLKTIEADFSKPASTSAFAPGPSKDKVEDVPDIRDMQSALLELGTSTKQKTAALYTLIGEDKFHVILIQPDGELRSFEFPIKAADLNEKILQFYGLLQSPTYDPRRLGKELYDIIFKPVEIEVNKVGVQTLMWQLDGNLRYLPMAALFDGKKYLVERYQSVVFTRVDKERMTRAVSSNWTGTGFGSSQAHTVDLLGDGATVSFTALPGVTAELASIFRTTQTNETTTGRPNEGPNGSAKASPVEKKRGILDGDVFTDARFTRNAFYGGVKQRRPLVHISSHFSFRPGDDSRSFLLLGNGTALTLNELKKQARLFDGVDLLTLSACNTALQKANADGREIDGFAELAQRLGAGAVMATLWSVSDNSTPWLMREFYQTRQNGAGLTKAEGLRRAQLALLDGKAQTQPLPGAQKGSSLVKIVISASGARDTVDTEASETIRVDEKHAPLFRRDEKKPFAHPYYWAPFILIGNWK